MLTKAEIQRLRSLREKKHREALGLFVIEGEKVVAELVAAKFPFVEIYATAAWAGLSEVGEVPSLREADATKAQASGMRASRPQEQPRGFQITPDEMARISHFPTPSSVFAVGKITREPLAAGGLDRGLTLALDGVQDAGNVGTLLRVADWFGFDRVVLSPECADVFHQKVINASMGSFSRVRTYTTELSAALAGVKAPVLGCDLSGDDVHGLRALADAVVVIGSEGQGLSPAVKKCVTHYVTIPRYGAAESLNAGVAAAIVCDNLRRALR
jgi:RNA methyltransferase, TrmH family